MPAVRGWPLALTVGSTAQPSRSSFFRLWPLVNAMGMGSSLLSTEPDAVPVPRAGQAEPARGIDASAWAVHTGAHENDAEPEGRSRRRGAEAHGGQREDRAVARGAGGVD